MTERKCEVCGKLYLPMSPTQKYCSMDCADTANKTKHEHTCKVCGKKFRGRRGKVYCSPECLRVGLFGNRQPSVRKRQKPSGARAGIDRVGEIMHVSSATAEWRTVRPGLLRRTFLDGSGVRIVQEIRK